MSVLLPIVAPELSTLPGAQQALSKYLFGFIQEDQCLLSINHVQELF